MAWEFPILDGHLLTNFGHEYFYMHTFYIPLKFINLYEYKNGHIGFKLALEFLLNFF